MTTHRLKPTWCALAALILWTASALADVRLHSLFTDHMVLQRGQIVPIWGWADEGETVNVIFRGQIATTTAQNGKWIVYFPKQKAGGPEVISVQGKNQIEVKDVLIGEVWICSGQSNMEWSLRASFESETAISTSANSQLRLFSVPKLKADAPVEDVKAHWEVSAPETVPGFSAVAYFFGRELQKSLGVPVGLIHTSWGGSPAEVWMSEAALSANPDHKRDILDSYAGKVGQIKDAIALWEKENTEAKAAGKPMTRNRPGLGWKPTELYNGMIAPLLPYSIAGAIWYQGESNAGRAWQYRDLFAQMILNWRQDFNHPELPFLAVQLAPWDKNRKRSIVEIAAAPGDSDWAELREAQDYSAKVLKNVGIAVITDVGDKDDIHPTKKEPVGARLALAAQKIAYKKNIVWTGPTYDQVQFKKGQAIVTFKNTGSGLETRMGQVSGFSVAGVDQKFHWAKAEIAGKKVIVSSTAVPQPVAVRFGWADYPVVDLWNNEGLPASPFRTDDFLLTTKPK